MFASSFVRFYPLETNDITLMSLGKKNVLYRFLSVTVNHNTTDLPVLNKITVIHKFDTYIKNA